MFSTDINYEVVTFSIGDTKAGTKMGKLQLKDPKDGALLNCILWEETLNRMDDKLFRCGNILRIVSATFNEKYNNCLVSALELVKEAKLGLDKAERDELFEQILTTAAAIKDEKLSNFLVEYLDEHKDMIKIAPAAKMMHHNYLGGLLVHTTECLEFAKANMEHFKCKMDEDEIYAACILHDIGKIFEYTINEETGLIDYAENFRKEWVSHSQYGFSLCMLNDFKSIAKMIAAHHARAEWGAIVDLNQKDLEPKVYLLHHIDDLSAKFGKINVSMLG